jgi:peptidoglycan/LPS O-acetylase OafA/YrhL
VNPSLAMFLSFVVVGLFSFISIAAWTGTRHQERKDFYRTEMLKKLAESGQGAVLEYLREEERQEDRRRAEQRGRESEGNRLVGLILLAVGSTMAIAMYYVVRELPVYLFGLIPASIGVVFLFMSLAGGRRSA